MTEAEELRLAVDNFIQERIDTVPHLEALLLLWNARPQSWFCEDIAKALFIDTKAAKLVLHDLVRQKLAQIPESAQTESFSFCPSGTSESLMAAVTEAYRRDLIRITRMIHSKPAAAVREFARAFRFTKEQE
jgi:hypothetical protein